MTLKIVHVKLLLELLKHSPAQGLNSKQVVTTVFVFWPRHVARGILVPRPGIKPVPLRWKCRVLTTGPPGKSCDYGFYLWYFTMFKRAIVLISPPSNIINYSERRLPPNKSCTSHLLLLLIVSSMLLSYWITTHNSLDTHLLVGAGGKGRTLP